MKKTSDVPERIERVSHSTAPIYEGRPKESSPEVKRRMAESKLPFANIPPDMIE
jgi:hypothetical protein